MEINVLSIFSCGDVVYCPELKKTGIVIERHQFINDLDITYAMQTDNFEVFHALGNKLVLSQKERKNS